MKEQQNGVSLLCGKSLFKNFTYSIFLPQQWRKHNKVLPEGLPGLELGLSGHRLRCPGGTMGLEHTFHGVLSPLLGQLPCSISHKTIDLFYLSFLPLLVPVVWLITF